MVETMARTRLLKPIKWVREDLKKKDSFWPTEELKKKAWVSSELIYKEAAKDPVAFWGKLAREEIDWYEEFSSEKTYWEDLPHFKWFVDGKLNACYNALDRHVKTWRRNKAAIIWEPESVNEPTRVLTYYDLFLKVNKFANVLKSLGVKKGDRVGIYLPLIPEVQIAMLACARIGAIHSVVFSAFSGRSLKERMIDAEVKVLVTADGYYRRGRSLNLKANADIGVEGTDIKSVVVVKRIGLEVDTVDGRKIVRLGLDTNMIEGRDFWWHDLMKDADSYCEPEIMDSEDTLFILYTSGTTGKPKGIIHETGGYITQALWTTKWNFDMHDEDLFWCTADVGWITGHTYGCYGPLLCGATMVHFEGAPNYPDIGRWWNIIQKYGVTIFYTAPTAIRMFMQWGEEWPKKYDLSSLRVLGTVGEPINKEAWMWYFKHIGGERCPLIDTWWQTETGGALINSLPGIGPFIPTVAGRSFPGITSAILDEEGNPVTKDEGGYLVLKSPFAPGMLRGVFKNPERYEKTYFGVYGNKTYYTSDGARFLDEMGNIRLTGRVDDVMKVAGHRLSTAELENALTEHPSVVECAVVATPHPIKGEVPIAFVILKGEEGSDTIRKKLMDQVNQMIGPTARPDKIIFTEDLPKTRSGKIVRRLLKTLVKGEKIGDVTTLMNPESVEILRKKLASTKQS